MPATPQTLDTKGWSLRLALICLLALAVSLPMAWISLGKALLFVAAPFYLLAPRFDTTNSGLRDLWTPRVILLALLAFALSLLWSQAAPDIALRVLSKHGKLLEILLLIGLIRNPREARIGVLALASGQALLLLGSWLMACGVQFPWKAQDVSHYVVFSSYLDQSIMFASTAGLFWHLRKELPFAPLLGAALAVAGLANALLLLQGRTGYLIAIATITLAAMWCMPRRLRLSALIGAPLLVGVILFFGATQTKERLSQIVTEGRHYSQQAETGSSSGWRLNAWHRSLQAISERPWTGHGVGSWTDTVKRIEGDKAVQIFGSNSLSNPHQEFLLWGVELGLGGLLLALALVGGLLRDARTLHAPSGRALISLTIAMALACAFNSALYDDLIGDFFCVAIGLVLAHGLRKNPEQKTLRE